MKPTKLLRVTRALQIAVTALLVCGLPSYGQRLDPRMARDAAAKAATARGARATSAALTIPPPTAVGTFVTFDVPGAVNGTVPFAINNAGVVTGYYGDNIGSGFHGFVRAVDGAFVTFDVPGAVNATVPSAINAQGTVAGTYYDVNFNPHSFLRAPNGALTTFDPPGAVNGSMPSAITADGVILGVSNPFGVSNPPFDSGPGFMRDPSGTFTAITGPGSLTGQFDGYISFSFVSTNFW